MSDAPRSYASGTICIGAVAIPVKLFTATSESKVSFNMLHKGCLEPVKQALVCPKHNAIVLREDVVRGYEHAPDQYAVFTDEEIKALEATRPASCDIIEFVPKRAFDPLFIEKNIYLGPDKGAAKAYALIAETLEKVEHIGIGTFCQKKGKDTLVALRPHQGGLILSECFFAEEVRPFVMAMHEAEWKFTNEEQRLAVKLVGSRARDRFEPTRFRDTWSARVKEAVEKKVAGEELSFAPPTQQDVCDELVEAMRRSIPTSTKKKASRARAGARV